LLQLLDTHLSEEDEAEWGETGVNELASAWQETLYQVAEDNNVLVSASKPKIRRLNKRLARAIE
jgi:hypothetical protein